MPLLYHEIEGNCTRNPSNSSSNLAAEFYQLETRDFLVDCRCLIKPKMSGYVIVPEGKISLEVYK